MAVSAPVLATPAVTGVTSAGTGFSVTTASFTPTADGLLVAIVSERVASGSGLPSTVSGAGLTWTKRQEIQQAGGDAVCLAIWTAPVGSSPTAGTVTGSWASGAHISLMVVQVTGHDPAAPITQGVTAQGTAATLTATLPASPATDSLIIAAVADLTGAGIDPDIDYTELAETSVGSTPLNTQAQYRNGNADTTAAWSSLAAVNNVAAAIEIAAAATTAGPNIIGQMVVGGAPVDMHGWIVQSDQLVEL